VGLDLAPLDDAGALDVIVGLVLPCWTLLGMLDRAMELTRAYILQREQFGQPLATFQGVQFQLTDAEVERVGLEELVAPKPSTTRSPCERPRSRRPTWCSASRTSCTAPSASATRRPSRGSRGSACRSAGRPSDCQPRPRTSYAASVDADSPASGADHRRTTLSLPPEVIDLTGVPRVRREPPDHRCAAARRRGNVVDRSVRDLTAQRPRPRLTSAGVKEAVEAQHRRGTRLLSNPSGRHPDESNHRAEAR